MFIRYHIPMLALGAIGVAAVGLAVTTAGSAAAGSVDDAFLSQVTAAGISSQGAIDGAHLVCKELAAGASGVSVAKEILSETDLTSQQAATFVVLATRDYCPQYSSQLDA